MSRTARPLLLGLTLAIGVALGVALDRGGRTSRRRPRLPRRAASPRAPVAPPVLAVGSDRPPKPSNEDDVYRQLDDQYERFRHINQTFEMVARAVSPAVVHIVAHKTSRGEDSRGVLHHFEETGSGVIVRGDRNRGLYVLTNNHVIEGAQPAKINIFLHDGRSLRPDRYWLDKKADIAVLNLARDDLPAARLGNSDEATVGTWVLAVGSPFGLTHSVSQGIISARGRHMEELEDVENQDFLQTDAAINPGNSGGPLVNMRGEVIGINNSIASEGGGNEGVGFSIPINLARWIMNQLLTQGRVSRGALGIDLHPNFRPEDAVSLGLERPRGAWIDRVHPGSPAASGGLHGGDVIQRFNGVEISDLNQLINLVSMAPIGQPAEVVVWRSGKNDSFRVTVAERDRTIAAAASTERRNTGGLLRRDDRPGAASSFALGMELVTMDAASASRWGLPGQLRGAPILQVVPNSPLAHVLKPLDLILTIDGRSITTVEQAIPALSRPTDRDPIVLGYGRVNTRGTLERQTIRVP